MSFSFVGFCPQVISHLFLYISVDAWILTFFPILITYFDVQIVLDLASGSPFKLAGFYVLLTRPHSLPQPHFLAQNGPPFIPSLPHPWQWPCLQVSVSLAKSDFLYCLIFANLIGEK